LRDLHRLTLQMIFFFAGGKLINSKTSTQTNVSINHGLRVVSQMGPKAMIESIIDMFNARPHESFYGSLWFSNPPKKKNTRKPKRKEWKGSLRQVASTPTSLLFYFFFFFFFETIHSSLLKRIPKELHLIKRLIQIQSTEGKQ
jgi:hypothetical protein